MSEDKKEKNKITNPECEKELPVIDYEEEYRKQTGKDLETGEYVTQ